MGWTAPRDWTVGEIVTEDMMDTHVKNNLRYLHGDDGATSLVNSLILPDGAGFYIHIPGLTTTQRDALTPTAGMLIYNNTTTQFNKYENGAWRSDLGFNSDHGGLGGLTDDDHTQYQKENILTTAGDIPYATGASTWDRLGIGTAGKMLVVNAGATAPEWSATVPAKIAASTYAGDNADNKQIAVGFVCKLVIITQPTFVSQWTLTSATPAINVFHNAATAKHAVCAGTNLHATDGFTVSHTGDLSNETGTTYTYVAIG